MAFGGDVDTLSLTFDKLQYIFNGYGQIRDSFIDVNSAYKQGKIVHVEFFTKTQEGVMRFSALEFLAIRSIFEIKKAINRKSGIVKDSKNIDVSSTSEMLPSSHSISSFVVAGVLPTPNSVNSQKPGLKNCSQCGFVVKMNVNFCTICGAKL